MKRTALFVALIASTSFAAATPWVYRGALSDSGRPANGAYDLRLTLMDAAGARAIVPTITMYDVQVRDGSFAADVDFGIDLDRAESMQLLTEVAQGGGAFVALGSSTRFDPKAALTGVCWDTQGNAGTSPATDFIGTTDAQPLVLKASGGIIMNAASLPSNGDDLVIGTHASGDADSDLAWLTRKGKLGRIFLNDSNGTFQWNSTGLTGANFLSFVNGAKLTAGGVFTNASSRELKAGFVSVDPLNMLDRVVRLPITTWHYKTSSEGEHIGPVAEDFKAIFGLGGDGKSIPTVDADGVALAAIQGLNQKLEAENASLRTRLDAIEAQLSREAGGNVQPTGEGL